MSRSTHLFVVAVEKYLDKAIRPVAFAEADGREFAEAWVDACTDTVVNEVLVNADATKTAVMSRFKAFCRHVGEDDMLVFFYAGHGVRLTGSNRLTTHDTLVSDLDGTTIVLSELLDLVTDECKSKRSILFIDACHSGIQLDARMRGIVDSFSVTEFDQFCSDAEYRVGFASCKSDESSWSHGSVKHGLWTHLILNALRGNAPEALHKGALVSSTSLQDYLAKNLPPLLRQTIAKKGVSQTPCLFGNHTKTFVVADLADLLSRKAAGASVGLAIADTKLIGRTVGHIKSLSGFRKGSHRVPDRHTSSTEAFVLTIGAAEVEELGKELHESLRNEFGYKRRELRYEYEDGIASITAPDFTVSVELKQSEDDPGSYVLEVEVGEIQNAAVVHTEAFVNVFNDHCDTVSISLDEPIDVGERIDQLENNPDLAQGLDYDADGGRFTLEIDDPPLTLSVTQDRIEVCLSKGRDLAGLIGSVGKVLEQLADEGLALLPPPEVE